MHDGAPPRNRSGGSAGVRTAPDAPDPAATPPAGPDLRALARDWIALWQSELTAAAADREVQEAWQTLARLWAGGAAAMLHALPRGAADASSAAPRGASRHAGAAQSSRPAAAAAAPDPRDAEIDRLARRIADLERRLAEIERTGRD
jgi:hypothetical protein